MARNAVNNLAFARAFKALKRAEEHYIGSLGYDPVEAVRMIYERAIKYYDSVFPNDEMNYRNALHKRYELRLKWAKRKLVREQNDNRSND